MRGEVSATTEILGKWLKFHLCISGSKDLPSRPPCWPPDLCLLSVFLGCLTDVSNSTSPKPSSGAAATPAPSPAFPPQQNHSFILRVIPESSLPPLGRPARKSCPHYLQKLTPFPLPNSTATISKHTCSYWTIAQSPKSPPSSTLIPFALFPTVNTLVRVCSRNGFHLTQRKKQVLTMTSKAPPVYLSHHPPHSKTLLTGPQTFRHLPSAPDALPQRPAWLVLSLLQVLFSGRPFPACFPPTHHLTYWALLFSPALVTVTYGLTDIFVQFGACLPLTECELSAGALPCSLLCPQHWHPVGAPQMFVK